MKLELRENMYIRTKDGIIDKVIIDYNGHCASSDCECKHISCAKDYYDEDKVAKASYNIIDILEKGDYVNGVEVINIDDKWITMSDIQVPILKSIANGMIKTIVTKEQFEQMAYKVGK